MRWAHCEKRMQVRRSCALSTSPTVTRLSIMSAVRDRIKMDDAGNVLDKDGKPRLSESGEFVDSRMHSGSGSPNDAGSGGGIAHLKTEKEPRRSLMTPPEKAAFMNTHGSDAYLNLPL